MTTPATHTPATERIYTLDVVRGFALLGIFIMNMPWFNTSFHAGADGTDLWPEWWDQWTLTATEVLFSGKFNSMFSMLFAVGFILQLERLEARDPAHAKSIYLRRISWLLVFGLIHLCVQVPLSRWWLSRFELGPMEWLWRRLTYGSAKLQRAGNREAMA